MKSLMTIMSNNFTKILTPITKAAEFCHALISAAMAVKACLLHFIGPVHNKKPDDPFPDHQVKRQIKTQCINMSQGTKTYLTDQTCLRVETRLYGPPNMT